MPASKSAYIAGAGVLAQFLVGIILIVFSKGAGFAGLVAVLSGAALILFSFLGIIPFILLWFEKTAKIGAVLSLIFGIFGVVSKLGIVVGVFLIIAGVLYLWKKF